MLTDWEFCKIFHDVSFPLGYSSRENTIQVVPSTPQYSVIRIPYTQSSPSNAGIVRLLQQPLLVSHNNLSPSENLYTTPSLPPPYDKHVSMQATVAPNVARQNAPNVSPNLDSTLKALLTWSNTTANKNETINTKDSWSQQSTPESLPSLETLFEVIDVRSLANEPDQQPPEPPDGNKDGDKESAMDVPEEALEISAETHKTSSVLTPEESDSLNRQFKQSCRTDRTDSNDDWCSVCKDGGELICCSFCPRVFHIPCHVPVIPTSLKLTDVDWRCMMCTDVLNCPVPNEGNKRRVVSGTLSGRELMICERLLLEMFCHPKSYAFHTKVSSKVPNYYKIIKKPMDLMTMQTKLSVSCFERYANVNEFIADMLLIFSNCRLYNEVGSDLHSTAIHLEKFFYDLLNLYLPDYTVSKLREELISQDSSVVKAAADNEKKSTDEELRNQLIKM